MDPEEEMMWDLQYYHGLLPREDVEAMLVRDGDFLVRRSEETTGQERVYVLSVNVSGHVNHAIFRQHRGMIAVDFRRDRGCSSIERFIEAHLRAGNSVSSETFVSVRRPIHRKNWELAHSAITLGAELGKGAFGVVRRGTFRSSSRSQPLQVAIKEVSQTSTKEQIKEYMNEARIMRQLDHKNVVKFHGVAVGQEPLMIIMELATDGSLTDYLKKQRRSARSKLYMCAGAAAGLEHVHSKGIIHCDIAARNCLFSNNVVKIADFGLAHKGAVKTLDLTKPVPIKWLPPEAIHDRRLTQKSDSWAYGVMCWEIFNNGQVPYRQMAGVEVVQSVVNGNRLEFPEEAPAEFADLIVQHIWDDNARNRYSLYTVHDWMKRHLRDLAGPGK